MSTGEYAEINRVRHFLIKLKNDYQLDKKDDRYLGYINVYEDGFVNQEDKDAFAIFVKTWPKYRKLMKEVRLDIQTASPDIDETCFMNWHL